MLISLLVVVFLACLQLAWTVAGVEFFPGSCVTVLVHCVNQIQEDPFRSVCSSSSLREVSRVKVRSKSVAAED